MRGVDRPGVAAEPRPRRPDPKKITLMSNLRHLLPLVALLACATATSANAQQGSCGGPIAQMRRLVESDVATGNLNAPVGQRFSADLDRASAACSAGHGGEAMHLLGAAKARYGYH